MSTLALGPYDFAPRDLQSNFALPLLYIGWDQHMMFSAPLAVPLDLGTTLQQVVDTVLPRLYGEHPEFARIDWRRVQWFRSAVLFSPRLDRGLADQGFRHKSVLRFRTPGLQGIRGSCG